MVFWGVTSEFYTVLAWRAAAVCPLRPGCLNATYVSRHRCQSLLCSPGHIKYSPARRNYGISSGRFPLLPLWGFKSHNLLFHAGERGVHARDSSLMNRFKRRVTCSRKPTEVLETSTGDNYSFCSGAGAIAALEGAAISANPTSFAALPLEVGKQLLERRSGSVQRA
eukprot:1491751-Amphidinium_carterae.1